VTGRPAIFFSAPVFDARGKTLAVVLSRLNLSGIGGLIDRDLDIAGPGTFGTLLDQDGIRIARSQSEENRAASGVTLLFHAVAPIPDPTTLRFVADRRFGTGSTSSVTISPLPEVAAALSNPSIKTFETSADYSTERHFAAVAALSSKPWHYVLMTPVSTFTGNADFEARLFGVLALLVALGTIVGVTIISRNFTRPIAQLTSVADRISLGELDAQIDIHRQDEIGDLADSLSRMQTSLQAAVERLRARRSSG
jgi:methyl-accepting chemotaxis protein